ncbi:MAG: hypothetical protein IPG53_09215 [Ignavibacteriales bacterium]|nr:hypothetical protein [Ignavibacteriales bacterium]
MNFTNRHFTNFMFVLLIAISSIIFSSCSTMSDHELKPGHSLGVASIPNLRDMGGYKPQPEPQLPEDWFIAQINSITLVPVI